MAFFGGMAACTGKNAGDAMASGTVFTLPAGYGPDATEDFPCLSGDADLAGGDLQAGRCEVSTGGDVTVPSVDQCSPSRSNPATLGQSWIVMLDGISFRAGPACSQSALATCSGRAAGDACTFASQGATSPGICSACAGTTTLACQSPSSSPQIASVSPAVGVTGVTISIVGTNFLRGAIVTVGSANAAAVVLNSTLISATVPAPGPGAAQTVNVAVTNPDGQVAVLANGFKYVYPAPQVSSIAPNAGQAGTVVEIVGANFLVGARLFFDASEAGLPTLVDSTRMIAVVPAHPVGPADVTVMNTDGQSGTLGFGFNYFP